jgi:PKD repeat protein
LTPLQAATLWAWTFGDGATSSDQNPTHLYAGTGTYDVCLIASDLCGTDTFCQTITVCLAPQADFSYFASSSSVINFIDESDDATSWFWDFGDGLTSTDANPVHEYVTGGNFEVCLVATNSCSSDTFCQTIIIECPPFEGAFSFTQSIDTAYFTDESPNAVSWLWDFGDGGSSVDQNPNHIYGADGTYTVCLTVSDGCTSDTTCSEIEVVGTSAGQLQGGEFFSVYPNPINGFARVTFTLTSDSWISVTLNDISGRVMKNIATGNYTSGNHTMNLPQVD